MPLTQESFCRLPLSQQLQVILSQGTFLSTRYEGTYAITQYQLSEFRADLYYSAACSTVPERIQAGRPTRP